ncbi:nucleoside deaminase [Polaromonas sp. CT11-55]|uniref:nucleoside deaminase n=1 Tax=Polaromonas sp. CT11-55 TaxID=3243045 RepID=UPI0039A602C5
MTRHDDYMRRAIELARSGSAAGHGGPFGCVIVKDDVIVGESCNRVVSSTDPTAHGEIMAIRAAAKQLGSHDLSGCEVYNISVPCPMCMAAMYWARISKIYYCCKPEDAETIGFDNAEIDRQLARPLHERSIPAQEMPQLHPEAWAVYEEWARRAGRIRY